MDTEEQIQFLKQEIWPIRNDVIVENLPTLPNFLGLTTFHLLTQFGSRSIGGCQPLQIRTTLTMARRIGLFWMKKWLFWLDIREHHLLWPLVHPVTKWFFGAIDIMLKSGR